MKKLVLILSIVTVLGFSTLAHASLVNNGGGLIYDTDLNITWYDGPPKSGNWVNVALWASSLTLGSTTAGTWRLPSVGSYAYEGYNITGSEMGHLYYVELENEKDGVNMGPFINLRPDFYWSDEAGPVVNQRTWGFNFLDGHQYWKYSDNNSNYGMAVHEGNVGSPVPIPAAVWLLGSGLVGIIGIRRRFKK
jgi:hypothetical protein